MTVTKPVFDRLGLWLWAGSFLLVLGLALWSPNARSVVHIYRHGSEAFLDRQPLYQVDVAMGYLYAPAFAVLYVPLLKLGPYLGNILWHMLGFSVLTFAAMRQVRKVGHFGCLTQELEELESTQVSVASVKLWQCRIGELPLDLPDVLFNPRRGRDRFLVLKIGKCRLVLLVREVDADRTGSDQRDGHERKDQQKILAKEPAAILVARCRFGFLVANGFRNHAFCSGALGDGGLQGAGCWFLFRHHGVFVRR